jgi:chromate transporter
MRHPSTIDTISPSFGELLRVFARIGLLSFGGPAGQIALMHRILVDEKKWVEEQRFLHALNFCMLLPGPEAQQLATYIGWRLHGVAGGLAAGLLFVLPGAAVIAALTFAYATAAGIGWFAAMFLGVKAAVIAIVVQALLRIGGRALKTPFQRILAASAFVALFAFDLPFPLVVLGAGALGWIAARARPEWLALQPVVEAAAEVDRGSLMRQSLRAVLIWGAIWAAPVALAAATLGGGHVLVRIAIFFSQLAVVTFGGAYAVLAYMAQQAVDVQGWLSPGEMADGLGLAETTPGPLILVTQFVGQLAAMRAPEPFGPVVAALLGAGMTLWVTFAPCFLWIFALAPWIERLRSMRALGGALAALTAAVVGVIANLTLWFALHVLFARLEEWRAGPLAVELPILASFDARAGLLAVLAGLLLFTTRAGVVTTLAVCAGAGLALGASG